MCDTQTAVDRNAQIALAWQAREHAYAPYSNFRVGALLVADDESTFAGANVENLSFGLTNCAERVAIGAAVAAGARRFSRIIVVADTTEPISPCGACRQVMAEFGIGEIISANSREMICLSLEELLPRAATGILDRA